MMYMASDFFGEVFLRYLAYTVLFFIVMLIAIPIKNLIRKYQLKKYPSLPELHKIKGDVRSLLAQNKNYTEILEVLKEKYSFPKFMMEGFIIDVDNEEKALVLNPKQVYKSNFNILFPENWKVKPLDQSLDQNQFFTIEGSYSGIIVFTLLENDLDFLPSLKEIHHSLSKQYSNYKVGASISKWGDYTGEGNLFVAAILNNEMSGKVFRYQNKDYGFYISLGAMNDDYHNVEEGFKLIEDNFKYLS